MADPGFVFGGNTGITEEGLRTRRAIAAALASKRMKAPKTVGEGMTYFGESLNEALGSYMLGQNEQELAARAAEQMAKLGLEPAAAPATTPAPVVRPPAPTVRPGMTGRPTPAPAYRPPVAAVGGDVGNPVISDDTIAQALEESGETVFDNAPADQGAVPPVQLAALPPDAGATVSDAPPVGVEPPLPPNPPIVSDIQPYQVAQAGGGAVPPPGAAPAFPPGIPNLYAPRPNAPTPSGQPANVPREMPELPAYPKPLPLNEKERRGFQASQYGATESVRNAGKNLQAIGAQERAIEEARIKEEWSKDYAAKEAIRQKWHEFGMPKNQADYRKQVQEEGQREREQAWFGDQGRKPYADAADASYKTARTIPSTVATLDRAAELVDTMIAGGGANTSVILSKLAGMAGVPVKPGVSDSEIFQSIMTQVYGPIRADVVGTGGQNTTEGRTLERAVGGNIDLEPRTIREVIGSLRKVNEHLAAEHHKNLRILGTDDPLEQSRVYGKQGLPMENIVPRDDVNRLREMIAADPSKSREIAKKFDEAWHTPGLAEKVWNSRR